MREKYPPGGLLSVHALSVPAASGTASALVVREQGKSPCSPGPVAFWRKDRELTQKTKYDNFKCRLDCGDDELGNVGSDRGRALAGMIKGGPL